MTRQFPDGPDGLPLVGNVNFMSADRLTYLETVRDDYGDVAYLHIANRNFFLLNHPDYIHQVLVSDYDKVQKTPTFKRLMGTLMGDGLLTSEEPLHGKQRRLVQPAFHTSKIKQYADEMAQATEAMLEKWADGETVEAHDAMTELTMRIVSRVLFSADVSDESDALSAAISYVNHDINERMFNPFIIPPQLPTSRNQQLEASIEQIEERMGALITARRREDSTHDDLLSMLVQATNEDGKQGMTDEQVLDEVLTLFSAGHETTANAMSWTLYLLAKHPLVADKLRDEVDSVVGERPITFDDVPKLEYTKQVIQESMRLYAPVWMISRTPTEMFNLGEYPVKPDDRLVIMPFLMHRNPQFWHAPKTFDPSRFDDEDAIRDYTYLPFGGGPRVCIGANFAMMEATILLATIAQRVKWEMASTDEVVPDPLVTLRPKPGVRIRVTRRS